MGSWSRLLTVLIEVSTTDSERVKTKDATRSLVGEERKRSWSFLERILRLGVVNAMLSVAGGAGKGGVSGGGFAGASVCLEARRGVRRGSCLERPVTGCGVSGTAVGMMIAVVTDCDESSITNCSGKTMFGVISINKVP